MFKVINIGGIELISMDGQCYWSQEVSTICDCQEINVLKTLYFHFGDDYQQITVYMNSTFPGKHFKAEYCRHILVKHGPENIVDRSFLSSSEICFMVKRIGQLTKVGNKQIWQQLAADFPYRDKNQVREQFFFALNAISKKLCYFYFKQIRHKSFYAFRLKSMGTNVWFLILYLAQLQLPQVYKKDQIILKIWESCKQFENYIIFLVENKFYAINESTNLPKFKFISNLNFIASMQLREMIEPILIIEFTLVRICQSKAPYDTEMPYVYRKTKRQINQESTEDQNLLIPKQNYNFFGVQMDNFEKHYPKLNKAQIYFILNSEIMEFLIPILNWVDQNQVRFSKSYEVD